MLFFGNQVSEVVWRETKHFKELVEPCIAGL